MPAQGSRKRVIIVGIGSNLHHPSTGSPLQVCEAAIGALRSRGISIATRSRWYRSAPIPASDQPEYVNGAARLVTSLNPVALLSVLHEVEDSFGRRRSTPNAARTLDLDLIAYGDLVSTESPVLPHPRMTERAFVLLPMREIVPNWVHSVSGRSLESLIANLPAGQVCEPLSHEE